MSEIFKNINWKSSYNSNKEEHVQYERKWYCNEKKEIHGSEKEFLRCKFCISELDKLEYESLKRLEFFINNYFIHNLGNLFSKMSTEHICKLYNIQLNYFRP